MAVFFRTCSTAVLAFSLAGCNYLPTQSGPEADYKTARPGAALRLPAELGESRRGRMAVPVAEGCSDCEIATAVPSTLRENLQTSAIESGSRWVDLQADADRTWASVVDFLNSQGFSAASLNSARKRVETEWVDSSRPIASAGLASLFQDDGGLQRLGKHRFRLSVQSLSEDSSRIVVVHEGVLANASSAEPKVSNDAELGERLLVDLLAWFGVNSARIQGGSDS